MSSFPNSKQITEEQERILQQFICRRLSNSPRDIEALKSIKAPIIQGKTTNIAAFFKSSLAENQNGTLASYLVLDANKTVCLFFALRCGELFRQEMPSSIIRIAVEAYQALKKLEKLSDLAQSNALPFLNRVGQFFYCHFPQKIQTFLQKHFPSPFFLPREALEKLQHPKIQLAIQQGLNLEAIEQIAKKFGKNYIQDTTWEPSDAVNRVSEVHPGVEINLFGINDDAREIWDTIDLPHKMGETLFWYFVVPKLKEIQDLIGCEYAYLFAADPHPDGKLIKYYRENLHFMGEENLGANKPRFDYACLFLYQSLHELLHEKDKFFQNFNPDSPV